MAHYFRIFDFTIVIIIAVGCNSKPSTNPQNCSNMIWDIPNCNDCDGFFGLYGSDSYATGTNSNRADGRIHLGATIYKDIDGGSWFVNDLKFEKKVNGYGHAGFSDLNKPDFDTLWGKTVHIKLSGNKDENIDSASGEIYMPNKFEVNFKINGLTPDIKDVKKPIRLKKGDNINLTWIKDEGYQGDMLITMRFNKPVNYSPKIHNDFVDFSSGEIWTPDGKMKRIVRTVCHSDNGEFEISSEWIEDFEAGEVVWVYVSRRTSSIISNNNDSFAIFNDYEVSRSFKIE